MNIDKLIEVLTDFDVLALTIVGESRGEPIEGQIAVGSVIRNRLHENPMRYRTYKDVCLERKQFSCWNENDPNRYALVGYANDMLKGKSVDPILKQCFWVARGISEWAVIDNTKGALHYITTNLFHSSNRPMWSANAKNEVFIGKQVFFNI